MQFLDAAAVAASLPWPRVIAAVSAMLESGCEAPPRQAYPVAVPGEPEATLLTMPAWLPGEVVGVKIVTVFPGNSARGLPSVNGVYALFCGRTGRPLGLMDGDELTVRRTAAASAIAARHLARADAAQLLVVGTGRLAPMLAAAHAEVRRYRAMTVWGRDLAKAERTAAALRDRGLPAAASPDLEAAARVADVISCATLATEPLIRGAWLGPGAHLDLVGGFRPTMREADDEAVRRADLVCVDTRAGALKEAGDLVQPIAAGVLRAEDIAADLHELVRGRHPGRTAPAQITLFKSVGYALEDLAAARAVAAAAPRP